MKGRVAAVFLSLMIIFTSIIIIVDISETVRGATTIYVDDSGGADYLTIQEGVDAANDGDTIYVNVGTYYENVVVNKTITLIGMDRNNTIIDGGGSQQGIEITADYVNLTGFSVTNSSEGILLKSNYSKINGNKITDNWIGIFCDSSNGNEIIDNDVSLNNHKAIYLYYSNENNVTGNNASFTSGYGIHLEYSNINDLIDNQASHNSPFGIYLEYSDDNRIIGNNVSSSLQRGLFLLWSNSNFVSENKFYSNNEYGIHISGSHNNGILNNIAAFHVYNGIDLYNSDSTAISDNILKNNGYDGISLWWSKSITLINNIMINDGIYIEGNTIEEWNTHNIDTSNKVNGKPVYYWKDRSSGTIPSDAGQVILANCQNIIIENQQLINSTNGVILGFSMNNLISSNTFKDNDRHAIVMGHSDNNTIIKNKVVNNSFGINIYFSNSNDILDNNVSSNNGRSLYGYSNFGGGGIRLYSSNRNNLSRNNIFSNVGYGVELFWSSTNNTLTENTISSNKKYNIFLHFDSSDNIFYHNNIVRNQSRVRDNLDDNIWDDGYPSGGNYWSDYTGVDDNGDGIGDTPYEIDSDSIDNYPLMDPWTFDTSAPNIILNSPLNNSMITSGKVIDFSVSDPNLNEVFYSINGGIQQLFDHPYNIETDGWVDGDYEIWVLANDIENNEITNWYNFTIDSSLPFIQLNSPQNNSIIIPGSELTFSISDENLNQTSYSINNESFNTFLVSYVINTSNWEDGDYKIAIKAHDFAGNINEKWYSFIIDTSYPVINLISPHNNSVILDSSILDFEISDENLKSVSYSNNNGSYKPFNIPYDINTSKMDDGELFLMIKAIDKADHVSEHWYFFRIDYTSPSLISVSIDNNSLDVDIKTDIIIEFSEPMNTESIQDSCSISPSIGHSFSWSNDNKTLTIVCDESLVYDTQYKISIGITAKDLAGRGLEEKFELEFTTEAEPKEVEEEVFPVPYILVALLTISIIVVLILFMVMSKRKKAQVTKGETEVSVGISQAPQTIQFTCSNCNNLLQAIDNGVTQSVTCPYCSTNLTVPSQVAANTSQSIYPEQPQIQH